MSETGFTETRERLVRVEERQAALIERFERTAAKVDTMHDLLVQGRGALRMAAVARHVVPAAIAFAAAHISFHMPFPRM